MPEAHNVRNWVVRRPTGPDVLASPGYRPKLGGEVDIAEQLKLCD